MKSLRRLAWAKARHMRLRIVLGGDFVEELDLRPGTGQLSAYITATTRLRPEEERRWYEIEAGLGSIDEHGHVWDEDPSAWVRAQRRSDQRRVG